MYNRYSYILQDFILSSSENSVTTEVGTHSKQINGLKRQLNPPQMKLILMPENDTKKILLTCFSSFHNGCVAITSIFLFDPSHVVLSYNGGCNNLKLFMKSVHL